MRLRRGGSKAFEKGLRQSPDARIQVAVTIVVVLFVVGAGLVVLSPEPSGSAEYAAWFQAIATFGSIMASIVVVWFQLDASRRDRLEEANRARTDLTAGVAGIVETLYRLVVLFDEALNDPQGYRLVLGFDIQQLLDVQEALASVPAHSLGDWDQTAAVFELRRLCRELVGPMKEIQAAYVAKRPPGDRTHAQIGARRTAINAYLSIFREALWAAGRTAPSETAAPA